MTRKCDCAGACGPQWPEVSRREFIEITGIGAAGALLAAGGTTSAFAAAPADLARWKETLLDPRARRVYDSATHDGARMHLGGIGTGNFEIGADGQLTTWQLFNTLRDGEVPFAFVARVGKTTRLLQTRGGRDWTRIRKIAMTGEYPIATLRFEDPELPVTLELDAFSPFAPLDAKLSSIPAAVFVFRVKNTSDTDQVVSLGALMTNPVGYDAVGAIEGHSHPNLGGNVNEVVREPGAKGLVFRAVTAAEATIDGEVSIATLANLKDVTKPHRDWPAGLHVETHEKPPQGGLAGKDPARSILWMEDAPADLSTAWLEAAKAAVEAGATLVFSGSDMPLLKSLGAVTGGKAVDAANARPDVVFEDFEDGYGKWKVEGKAFGDVPPAGTLPGQQPVSGFEGKRLVNSFVGGDDTVGRLISRDFTIERPFIRFLIGGGFRPTTQLRLVVDGQVVRSAAGRDDEKLAPAFWGVNDLVGKTAHFEIVDQQKGPWGHINVDRIVFADRAGDPAVYRLLDELLPARFRDVVPREGGVELAGREDREGTTTATAGPFRTLRRPLGKGQVVIVLGPILDRRQAEVRASRHRAFAILCSLIGVAYEAPATVTPKAPGFGTVALATTGPNATVYPSFDDWDEVWRHFSEHGAFPRPGSVPPAPPSPPGRTTSGAVASMVTIGPGESAEVPFLLTWHYPNKYNGDGTWMGCHYATPYPDAAAVLREAAANLAPYREKTERFRRTFYDSTLPYWLLDGLTSQAAILRHIGIVFRIASGDVYGWEGSNGCCDPTCTHVWGYEQSLARLFPDLEKDMRRIDFRHQQLPNGGINNRTYFPSPPRPTGERPFADGHASCILKAYREALNHPDDSWLKEYWPAVKKAVEYLIARDAAGSNGEPDGILQDDQWNTYDEALHGVTTFISGYYLAALRAGEAWARRVGDDASATRFAAIRARGAANLEKLCWNGEYFEQKLDEYRSMSGEVGPGCMSDQLIGQWWAHQLGLGYLFPRDRVVSALKAVFRHNWKTDLTGWKHMPRAFAGDGDKGLIICTWPKGGRPDHVMLYSDEVWTGIEYQVAAHLIYEGLIEEGLSIAKGARDRYDGVNRAPIPRNPWNEIECGGHYARAMSSWSLLLALSGYEYDGPARGLTFAPRLTPENFKAFFCGPEGWGSLLQKRDGRSQRNTLTVAEGRLPVAELLLQPARAPKAVAVTLGGKAVESSARADGDRLRIVLRTPQVVVPEADLVAMLDLD
ncbi:GH116 family glycosyl-hydrolase [Aquisphaera insulae]|uniref:GH116 family glycosyl-hydrolase n=1 Tax=Aquisphaera insulae TaxID=2712864 RepID=UPI0013ECE8A9|nr:GH116 family glycosyl-hydrolase [Aquisphaera insulae]